MPSLDQLDRESFNAGPAPFDGDALQVTLNPGSADHPVPPLVMSLDGAWDMVAEGDASERLTAAWADPIPAQVPGSVHTALLAAGRIPEPYQGRNDQIAKAESFKTWWLKRTFDRPPGDTLVFGGICDSCEIWLNGESLGTHLGMFAELTYDVADQLVDGENTLIVRLDPAQYRMEEGIPTPFFVDMNVGWLNSAVINNIFGWHYIDLPTIGIWRPVRVETTPTVKIVDPFVGTVNAHDGIIRIAATLRGVTGGWFGTLTGTIAPENFDGEAVHFTLARQSDTAEDVALLECAVPDPALWWPVDHGDPNLYRLTLSFMPGDSGVPDTTTTTFGIRTIEMRPLPEGPDPEKYDWTFVVNGKPMFMKGANWCTADALLRFDRDRYERFIRLARDSHMQLLRAWGSGMPETDDFFDLADRYGVMVLQEWPTAWNSHRIQPYEVLEETVRHNTLRLRNHPALIMWGGGNESSDPTGPAIDMMGRYAIELDGTRPFHRGEPYGGSIHSYRCYWGRQPLDHNLTLSAPFIGEFGLASMPNTKSSLQFLPDDEHDVWPPAADGSLAHHMPVFNKKNGLAILSQYIADFAPNTSLRNFVQGTQLAQATGVRHTLERARTSWPDATGALYYKLNDNNPAASWSSVDWYGVPKLAYDVLRSAFRPLHACVLFERLSCMGEPVAWPVYLLDDADGLDNAEWNVTVRAFNSDLALVKSMTFSGTGSIDSTTLVGEFTLDGEQTWSIPLFIVCELHRDGQLANRVFYWMNYTGRQGSLFDLPRCDLALAPDGDGAVVLANTGSVPAVCAQIVAPDHAHDFVVSDGALWLDPGEQRRLTVSHAEDLSVIAWNKD